MKEEHLNEPKVWVQIPEWIYVSGKEVEIRYQDPDGEWRIATTHLYSKLEPMNVWHEQKLAEAVKEAYDRGYTHGTIRTSAAMQEKEDTRA